jgi:acetyl esterase/lipase
MGVELMPSAELSGLVEGLRANGPDLTGSPVDVRAAFEAMLATIPFAGDLTSEAVSLGGVPGLRFASPQAAANKALLYLHGGAYVIGSATGYRSLSAELGRAAGAISYAIDYRLAPEHPYPAAIDDAVTAYRALLAQGIPADQIVIVGDSAGGGLTLATLMRLRDAGDALPAAALLISPWADLGCTAESLTAKAVQDPSLTLEGLRATAALYLNGTDARTPAASPVFGDLHGLPPLLIQVGTAEILLDDAIAVTRRAGQHDVAVDLSIWPHMVHVWHAFAFMLPEGQAAVAQAGAFLARHLSASVR